MRELLAYSQGAVVEEKLTLRIRADNNGDIYLPTAGYSPYGGQDCEYEWMVSVDGGEEVNYSGVGSSSGIIRVGYGLTPLSVHTVIVKPKEEEYGWLRAFGYKGTSIAESLVNIISDKSYKGYANSNVYSGNYFKAYQYYGCSNLINTDEELLPDTLEVIGDYYRYYEYAGCISLVSNAEEKILKTVKVIGDKYRGYQYQNCTGITKINMRAINWASVGNDYRLNQFENIGRDRAPMNIYIEGGIEEGGNWGLADSRVKNIYVYKDLVGDYQTKLSTITSSKIKKNDEWDNLEYEFIEYIGIADSTGKIRMPVGGYSTMGTQDCAYDWLVSIDGGEEEEITGTGSATYVSVGSGLIEGNEYRVVIKPKTIGWGWGRAFGFSGTGAESYIKEIIHDSYKCYASNRTDTGNYYKFATYYGCVNLINSYEKLPTSVVNIGNHYMRLGYMGCSGLLDAFWEVMHKGCVLGTDYRYQEYKNCSSLVTHQGIAGYSGTYPTNYKYEYLSGAGDNMDVYITRYEALDSGLTNSLGLTTSNINKIYCFIDDILTYTNNTYWSNITRGYWRGYYYGYVCRPAINIDELQLKWTKTMLYQDDNNTSSVGTGGMMILPGDKISLSYTYYPGRKNPGLITQKLDQLGVSEGVKSTYHIYDSRWANEGLRRWGDTNKFWYAINREDYYSYAYGHIECFEGGLGSNKGYIQPYAIPASNHNAVKQGVGLSKNGQYLWCRVENTAIQYIFNTPFSPNASSPTAISLKNWTSMEFSDDGMVLYLQNGYQITQYNLSSPRYIDSAVSTGKTFNADGGNFNFYKGDVYANKGSTIYKYSID